MHVEDVIGLDLGELEGCDHQRLTGCATILTGANGGDDLVDQVEGLDETFDDVKTLLGLVESVLGPAGELSLTG